MVVGGGAKRPRPLSAGSDGADAAVVPWETTAAEETPAFAPPAPDFGGCVGVGGSHHHHHLHGGGASAAADDFDDGGGLYQSDIGFLPHGGGAGGLPGAGGGFGGAAGRPMTRLLRTACLVFDFLRSGGPAEESSVRRALGNTQDVSKGLRRLLTDKLVRRSGRGGRQSPYVYEVSARGASRRHWASEVPPAPPPNPPPPQGPELSAVASVAALLAAGGAGAGAGAGGRGGLPRLPSGAFPRGPPAPEQDPYSSGADPAVARAYASAAGAASGGAAAAAVAAAAAAAAPPSTADANAGGGGAAAYAAAAPPSLLRPESAGLPRVSAAAAALAPPPGWPPPPPTTGAAGGSGAAARAQQQQQQPPPLQLQHEQGLYSQQQQR